MERHCSTGQSPQRAVGPKEGEEEEIFYRLKDFFLLSSKILA